MNFVKASRRTRERMWDNPRTTSHSLLFRVTICACSPSISISVRLSFCLQAVPFRSRSAESVSVAVNRASLWRSQCMSTMHAGCISITRLESLLVSHNLLQLTDLAAGEPSMESSQPCHTVGVLIDLVRSSLHFPGREPPGPQTLDSALKLNPTRWREWS